MNIKNLKSFIKGSSDPWSTTVSEDRYLDAYLKAKGLNPNILPTPTKVSHAKSNAFLMWKQNHMKEAHEDVKKQVKKESDKPSKGNQNSEHIQNEDVEQIDELKKSTLASYVKGAMSDREMSSTSASFKSGKAGDKYNKADETPREIKRGKGIDTALRKLSKEDKDCGCSKSAQMIKDIMKKKKVVKEDLYDHEKEDKSVATYGKKPKHDKADEKDSKGENKPKAASVLSGGKTLTGSPRDTVEIDPMMRVRPGQPDPTKKDDKKADNKDNKKKDK